MGATVTVVGRVGRLNDTRSTKAGLPMLSGAIAAEHYSSSAKANVTDWFEFVAFGTVAERMIAARVDVKSAVAMTGELHIDEPWTGKDGKAHSKARILVGSWEYLPMRRDDDSDGQARGQSSGNNRPAERTSGPESPRNQYQGGGGYSDDDIPF